jgi:thymidylate synthase (FAD)
VNVRLIAVSKPVVEELPGTPELLAYCARVSSTANQLNHETGGKLLRSLVRRKEWSPLEMVSLTMEIETTRDIARQILRHRSFSFQEFSQRYAKAEAVYYIREARLQDHKDRQNSIECNDVEINAAWEEAQDEVHEFIYKRYEAALAAGIAKEVARSILPEGMTPSMLYMAGTLRSWLHYCDLRCDRKTQKEHREIAERCRDILCEQFPDIKDIINPQTVA